jgi:hypothetical protein
MSAILANLARKSIVRKGEEEECEEEEEEHKRRKRLYIILDFPTASVENEKTWLHCEVTELPTLQKLIA